MGMNRAALQSTACLLWLAGHLAPLAASHLEPKEESEYPHACEFKSGTVAVDYLRRSLPTPYGTQLLPGTLIFEIAAYPDPSKAFEFPLSSFQLDWTKVDWPQPPVHAQYVVASSMRPEFSSNRRIIAGAGSVDPRTGEWEGVTIGGPPANQRFPGDPRHGGRIPETVPGDPQLKNPPPNPNVSPSRIIEVNALRREPIRRPVAGYVYFAYNGKLTKLHELKLTIRQGQESCELLIRK